MKVTSIILAGGKNIRLGRNKALETIDGKILIERVVERLKPLTSQTLVVTSQEQLDLPVIENTEVLFDQYPGKGPIGGIYTGLLAAKSSHSIVVACDMPFLNIELLGYMVELSGPCDAVIPRLEKRMMEPLHAVYSRSCLEGMKDRLERNELAIHSFLRTIHIRYVDLEELKRLDPHLLSFFNINFQSDLDRAIELIRQSNIMQEKQGQL